ncbi:MAG: type II/IV secretion system protein [Rhodocyclales bacterium]|nr:type II/IV secretion system protein [Rhodocyclales bacterium]
MNAPLPHRRLIGQVLLAQGLISEDQLRIALHEQSKAHQLLGRMLVGLGFISEATLRDALGATLGHQAVDLGHAIVDPTALQWLSREQARRHRCLPLIYAADRRLLTVASADPHDVVALDRLRAVLPRDLQVAACLAGEAEIARAIDRYYGHELSIDGILSELETGEIDRHELAHAMDEYSQPVVRLIDALLTDAVKRGASDIHFEPEAGFLRIRYRIDGLLRQIRALHKSYWAAMAVRLKVMSGMNIAETRAPQDGRVSLSVGGRSIDFRAATQPTLHGENVVLRILDRDKGIVPLAGLGLDPGQLDELKRMIARPEGILLVTGPTGSGKTTTLYSLLNHINAEGIAIMTLEDPVEYPLAMVRQTSVAEAAKLDFASGIRAMMRQDPDAILVGEIRDGETAAMAFRAAMTGHQVYSTLHCNSTIGAIPRLLDIGVRPDILAGNVVGIVAQRLVRRLCPLCRQPHAADEGERQLLGLAGCQPPPSIFRAAGCEACDFQGYRGRVALWELLRCDDDIDELIARRATARELRALAQARGYRTLAADGRRQVLDGVTALAEVARVVDLTRLADACPT